MTARATPTDVTLKAMPTQSNGKHLLPELLRPNFFPGQLLTSDDLTALSLWVGARLALQRQRVAWGIVCGLEVTGDSRSATGILLAPGYAVDPAGRDIVVNQEYSACVAQFCGKSGCGDVSTGGAGTDSENADDYFQIGEFKILSKYVCAIDLALHYKEEPYLPRPALTRNCGQPACSPSRFAERFELTGTVIPTPLSGPTNRPIGQSSPDSASQILDAFRANPKVNPYWNWAPSSSLPSVSGEDVAKWFSVQLSALPSPGAFLFLEELIADIAAADAPLPWRVAEALFWLIQTGRQRASSCIPCPSPTAGVPLARVWLDTSGNDCRILFIDNDYAKVRRLGHLFGVHHQEVNLSTLYGRNWLAVRDGLRLSGLSIQEEAARLPASPKGLGTLLQYAPPDHSKTPPTIGTPGQPLVALISNIQHWKHRIIDFYEGATARGNFRGEILDLVAVKPTIAHDDPSGLTTITTFPPDHSFKEGIVPNDGYLQFAFKIGHFGAPGQTTLDAGPLRVFMYDDLRGSLVPCDQDISDPKKELQLLTNTFKIPSSKSIADAVEFALLVQAKAGDDRNIWSSKTLRVQVRQQPAYVTPLTPSVVITKDKVTYSVKAMNQGPYAVTLEYGVTPGTNNSAVLKPNTQDAQTIATEEIPITAPTPLSKVITFTKAVDEFQRTINGFVGSPITVPVNPIAVNFNLRSQGETAYSCTVSNQTDDNVLKVGDLTLTKLEITPKEGTDQKPRPIDVGSGVKLTKDDRPFKFSGPANVKTWQIYAEFRSATIQFTKTTTVTLA